MGVWDNGRKKVRGPTLMMFWGVLAFFSVQIVYSFAEGSWIRYKYLKEKEEELMRAEYLEYQKQRRDLLSQAGDNGPAK